MSFLSRSVDLISEAPSGGIGGKRRMTAAPYPAYGDWHCRPDKRSASRQNWRQTPDGGDALSGLRRSVLL
ncbi:hypothetical protein C0557_16650 [Kosakonia sp. MUSA4]|nr:hypothetical protein C0557_16650 [Kosakonia sp. MUSA4]